MSKNYSLHTIDSERETLEEGGDIVSESVGNETEDKGSPVSIRMTKGQGRKWEKR